MARPNDGSPDRRRCGRLILLDVDLPGASGLDVPKRLVGDGSAGRTPVIMLSARSAEGEVLSALEQGAFDHIAKPFSLLVLMHRVRRALAR